MLVHTDTIEGFSAADKIYSCTVDLGIGCVLVLSAITWRLHYLMLINLQVSTAYRADLIANGFIAPNN